MHSRDTLNTNTAMAHLIFAVDVRWLLPRSQRHTIVVIVVDASYVTIITALSSAHASAATTSVSSWFSRSTLVLVWRPFSLLLIVQSLMQWAIRDLSRQYNRPILGAATREQIDKPKTGVSLDGLCLTLHFGTTLTRQDTATRVSHSRLLLYILVDSPSW